MACNKHREWISLEMDDQLAPHHVASLQEHLESCADCRAYRDDLRIGMRMLQATEPSLPENFDWKLQLGLSRAMREAARDSAYPWQDETPGWRRWLGRAGVSAAVGLAAVLTFAIMTGGDSSGLSEGGAALLAGGQTARLPVQSSPVALSADGSRRPLDATRTSRTTLGAGLQRRVSSKEFGGAAWATPEDPDLQRIRRLEQDNESMRRRLFAKDRYIQYLQAQLDSLAGGVVDRN